MGHVDVSQAGQRPDRGTATETAIARFIAKRIAARPDHAVPAQHDRLLRPRRCCRATSARQHPRAVRRPGVGRRAQRASSAPTGRSSRSTATGSAGCRHRRHGRVARLPPAGRPTSLGDALVNSAKLALLAFIIVVPLAILGGVLRGAQRGHHARPRSSRVGGLSATAIPEFVWAVLLILVFALGLGLFPATAQCPDGLELLRRRSSTCSCPRCCLVFVLFGYIARMARAGTIEALDADYTRTAIIKGLPQRTVLRAPRAAQLAAADDRGGRHPGRLPDRRPGGRSRSIFNYQGIGQALFRAAHAEGLPAAAERRADRRRRLPRRDADRRHPLLGPEPARPARGRSSEHPGQPRARDRRRAAAPAALGVAGDERAAARRERLRAAACARRRSSPARSSSASGCSARSSASCSSRGPARLEPAQRPRARRRPTTGSAPTGSAATSSRA